MVKSIFFIVFIVISFSAQGQLRLGMNEVYGSNCGIAGQHPQLRIKLYNLIKSNDVEMLHSWLFSSNSVRQVYALEGLLELNTMNESIAERIDELKDSQIKISTCLGCVYQEEKVADVVVKILDNN